MPFFANFRRKNPVIAKNTWDTKSLSKFESTCQIIEGHSLSQNKSVRDLFHIFFLVQIKILFLYFYFRKHISRENQWNRLEQKNLWKKQNNCGNKNCQSKSMKNNSSTSGNFYFYSQQKNLDCMNLRKRTVTVFTASCCFCNFVTRRSRRGHATMNKVAEAADWSKLFTAPRVRFESSFYSSTEVTNVW